MCVQESRGGVIEEVLEGDLGRGGTELALFVGGRLSGRMGTGRETCDTRFTTSVDSEIHTVGQCLITSGLVVPVYTSYNMPQSNIIGMNFAFR